MKSCNMHRNVVQLATMMKHHQTKLPHAAQRVTERKELSPASAEHCTTELFVPLHPVQLGWYDQRVVL